MKYRIFPNTDIRVSEVGFGAWTASTTWWGIREEAVGVRLLQKAFALGITFIDTADTYGNGLGETIVAKALKDKRSQIVIATKFGYDFYNYGGERTGQRELPQDFSPKFIRFACEQSLKRLETDYIDIYQFHNPRLSVIQDGALFEVLEQLKQEGKIRAYGVALGPAIGWRDEGLEAIKLGRGSSMQIIYNLLEQDPGRDFLAAAKGTPTGFLVRVPHSSGLLEGKYTEETTFPASDHRSHRKREWLIEGLKKLEKLQFLTEGRSMTIGQAALKWLLAEPAIMSVLPNIYNEEQLEEFAGVGECPNLTPEDLNRVADLYEHNFYVEPAATTV